MAIIKVTANRVITACENKDVYSDVIYVNKKTKRLLLLKRMAELVKNTPYPFVMLNDEDVILLEEYL